MLTVKELLIKAKSLIETPETWTQGTYAKDANGQSVTSFSTEATQFCAMGAIRRATSCDAATFQRDKCYMAIRNAAGMDLTDYNDTNDHMAVMAIFDKAIANCKE